MSKIMAEEQQNQQPEEQLPSNEIVKKTSEFVTEDQVRALIQSYLSEIGGWKIRPDEISSVSGKFQMKGNLEQITLGNAKAPLTGEGIFLGLDNNKYQFRAGDPVGDYILWDGNKLSIVGTFLQGGRSYIELVAGENLNAGEVVYLKSSDGKVYRAKADSIGEYNNVLGVVKDNVLAGQTAIIQVSGTVNYNFGVMTETIPETLFQSNSNWYTSFSINSISVSGRGFTFTTGPNVANITKASIYLTGGTTPADVYRAEIYKIDAYDFTLLYTSTNTVQPTRNNDYDFTFSNADLQPLTTYILMLRTVVNNGRPWYIVAGYPANNSYMITDIGTRNFVYENYTPAFRVYYNKKNYYNIGDNVYLSNLPGRIIYSDYPAVIVKIGVIVSPTQYLLDYTIQQKPNKVMQAIRRSGNGSMLCAPLGIGRNFVRAIVRTAIGDVIIDTIKTSASLRDGTNASIGVQYSNKHISIGGSDNGAYSSSLIYFYN